MIDAHVLRCKVHAMSSPTIPLTSFTSPPPHTHIRSIIGQLTLRAPRDGVVDAVATEAGALVSEGGQLVTLKEEDTAQEA